MPSRPARPPADRRPRKERDHVSTHPLQDLRQDHLGRLRPARRIGQGGRPRRPVVCRTPRRRAAGLPRPPPRPVSTVRFNLDRGVFVIAGVVTLLSLMLATLVSSWWLVLTAFVGLNMLQAGFTG